MAQTGISKRRALFYGSVHADEVEATRVFLTALIPRLLEAGLTIATREGTVDDSKDTWKWLDNLVLDVACTVRSVTESPREDVISYVSDDDATPSSHDRPLRKLAGQGRYALYRELVKACDVIILLGGRAGVYRFGIFAVASGRVVLPMSFLTGTARDLHNELAESVNQLPNEVQSLAGARTVPDKETLKAAAHAIYEHLGAGTGSGGVSEKITLAQLARMVCNTEVKVLVGVLSVLAAVVGSLAYCGYWIGQRSPIPTQAVSPSPTGSR